VVSWQCARTKLERNRTRARAIRSSGRLLVPARWGEVSDTGTTRVFLLDEGEYTRMVNLFINLLSPFQGKLEQMCY
jgi:hypothetical protein